MFPKGISGGRPRFELGGIKKGGDQVGDSWGGPCRPALRNRIRAHLDGAQELLGLAAGLVRSEAAMLANGDPPGLPALPVLGAVAFAATGEGDQAEAWKGIIP
jgi:hypothetical protein